MTTPHSDSDRYLLIHCDHALAHGGTIDRANATGQNIPMIVIKHRCDTNMP